MTQKKEGRKRERLNPKSAAEDGIRVPLPQIIVTFLYTRNQASASPGNSSCFR